MKFMCKCATTNVCVLLKDFGFTTCPPSVLRTLLMFLIGYGLDNNSDAPVGHPGGIYPYFSGSSPAIPIVKSIVLGSHESREIIHELLRQSLVLPCTNQQYRDIVRGAMHVLGVWAISGEDERPAFLRRSSSIGHFARGGAVSTSTSNASLSTMGTSQIAPSIDVTDGSADTNSSQILVRSSSNQTTDYAIANVYLRRYLLMIQTIFDSIGEVPDDTSKFKNRDALATSVQNTSDWDGLVNLYKDALNIYRAITVANDGIDIESQSWYVTC